MTNSNESLKLSNKFKEREYAMADPARCVDGRPLAGLEGSEGGAQMLGGSLLPVVVHAIAQGMMFDETLIRSDFRTLSGNGFGLGVHRGHHQHPEEGRSDCGFADNLIAIVNRAQSKATDYADRLRGMYAQEPNLRQLFDADAFEKAVNEAVQLIGTFGSGNIRLTGEPLIRAAEAAGAEAATVHGDHAEQAAFVNTNPEITFDTNAANRDKFQGFSLDLVQSMDQAEALGVNRNTAGVLSLFLYMATEEVLVEDKGKPALPLVVHG